MKSRFKLLAVALGASALTGAIMTIAGAGGITAAPAQTAATAPREVQVVEPTLVGGASSLELPVVTEALRQANLHARVTGNLSDRFVDLGDRVSAGQTLALVDTPETGRERERALAARQQALARLSLARSELARGEALVGKGYISRALLDEKRAKAQIAQADERAAAAEVARLDELLALRRIRAPFAGTVTFRGAERGDLVAPNASAAPLFTIAQADRLRVVAEVPQTALSRVRARMPVMLHFDEAAGPVSATVARSGVAVRQDSGTARIEMIINNTGYGLPIGAAGSMRVAGASDAGLLLPNNTIVTRAGRPHVALVESGRVRFAAVTLGRNLGAETEIRAGLSAGAKVILNPNAMLRDGDAVRAGSARLPA